MPALPVFAFDVIAVTVLTYGVYYRRHRRQDMALAFIGLNVGVMAVATVLSNSSVGAGLGLGLFGLLSIIRLRSSEVAQEEVAYYFAALTLGILGGVETSPAWLAAVLGTLLVTVIFIADHPRFHARDRHQLVVLDAAYTDEAELKARLELLLGAEVRRLVVIRLDLVRDLTEVDVRYRVVIPGSPAARPARIENHVVPDTNGYHALPVATRPVDLR